MSSKTLGDMLKERQAYQHLRSEQVTRLAAQRPRSLAQLLDEKRLQLKDREELAAAAQRVRLVAIARLEAELALHEAARQQLIEEIAELESVEARAPRSPRVSKLRENTN